MQNEMMEGLRERLIGHAKSGLMENILFFTSMTWILILLLPIAGHWSLGTSRHSWNLGFLSLLEV